MRKIIAPLVRAFAAIGAAVLLTIAIGGFFGWPTDPKQFRETMHKIDTFHQNHPVVPSTELDAFYASLAAESNATRAPHPIAAILMWHPVLLGAFTAVLLLVARPTRASAALVAVPTAVAVYVTAGLMPAAFLAAGLGIFFILSPLLSRLLHRRIAA